MYMNIGAQFLSFKLEAFLQIFIWMLFVFDESNSNKMKQVLKFLTIESRTAFSGSTFFLQIKVAKITFLNVL